MRPTGCRSVPPGSQKADPEWASRRSGKAPWKISLGPQKPQKRHLLPRLSFAPSAPHPSAPGYISVSLSTVSFPRFYHISSTGSWKLAVIASSVMPAGGGRGVGAKGQRRRKVREGGRNRGGGREEGDESKTGGICLIHRERLLMSPV